MSARFQSGAKDQVNGGGSFLHSKLDCCRYSNPACRIPATKCETLARFLPQTAKPKSLRRNTPETAVRYILAEKFSEAVSRFLEENRVRIGMDVMLSDHRHWLEYDFVALAVLLAGIGFVELIVLSI
jgi:hypothetical protein